MKSQTKPNNYNIQLDSNTDVIPITGLCKLTIMMLGVLSPQKKYIKASSSLCSLQT